MGKIDTRFEIGPLPVLPILEQLMQDESLYVRKSVANNLNDISKTHPHLLRKVAEQWYGTHPHTDWIIKHAYRTLLKKAINRLYRFLAITMLTRFNCKI